MNKIPIVDYKGSNVILTDKLGDRLKYLTELKKTLNEQAKTLEEEPLSELEDLERVALVMPNWLYGDELIREEYWVEYVQEVFTALEENHIATDWDATAESMKADYGTLRILGYTYYYKN